MPAAQALLDKVEKALKGDKSAFSAASDSRHANHHHTHGAKSE